MITFTIGVDTSVDLLDVDAVASPARCRPGRGNVPSYTGLFSMSHLRVASDRCDELIAAFSTKAGLVDVHDGFLDLQIWRSNRDRTEVIMVSRWRNQAAFTAYMKSADHRTSHQRMDPSLKPAIKLEHLGHLQTHEIVAQ